MSRRLAFAFIALLAACKKIDADKVVDLIEGMFSKHGIVVKAACPTNLDIKKDAKFKCTADYGGKTLTIDVTMTDDQGTVWAQLDGMILNTEEAIPEMQKH